jgi:ribosomal protein S18 acetylase RimI-like enzyme
MTYAIRAANPADLAAIQALFPRLAAFEIPPEREPADLWRGDAELLQQWAAGEVPECLVFVAVDTEQRMLGAAIARLREELLSHEPSAHLEVLVVADGAEGQGIGAALIAESERAVQAQGARSMTLHVFANNTRARRVYERMGYSGELIRYIKHLA